MSHDDDQNSTPDDSQEETPRQSPVIARDVAADPSKATAQGDASHKDGDKKKDAAKKDAKATSLLDKLGKPPATAPLDPLTTQQGVAPQDSSEVSEDDDDDDDVGVFLEEIFPDGTLPEFSVPTSANDEPKEVEHATGGESSDELEGMSASHEEDSEEESTQEPVEEPVEEPVVFDVSGAQVDDPEEEETLVEEIVDGVVEELVDESEELAPVIDIELPHDEIDQAELEAKDEEPAEESNEEASDEMSMPLPAVSLSPDVSPGAPLDTDGLPVTEQDVRGMLTEIGDLAKSCHMHSLSKEIAQERLPTLDGGRVTLVVLGEFNHGKSTVINALLGDEVLPMGITPTTAVITHLVHADEPVVTIQPAHHGEPYTIAYDEMEEAVKESGAEGEEPEYVEIGFPNKVLKNSLVLVDTPGVNDISRQKVEITYGYLPRADVILYVLDATQVLKKSEVTFIKDRLLKSSSDRIIFVLNKIDALSPDDIEEVVEYARERLTKILGPVELFTFSGRKALQAQLEDKPLPEEFSHFQGYLQKFLQEQRAFIILDSALSGGVRVSTLMEQNLAIKRQGYQLEREDLEQRIVAVRARLKESRRLIAENTQLIDTRVQGIAATAKHNLRIFTEQFSEQLPLQIERADASDVKKFLPIWIQETYKEWLEQEGSALARSLEELAEEIIQITNESLQQTVQSYQDEFGLSDELDLNVDTVAYDVGVFALGAFGVSIFLFANILVGSLLTLATPVLAYFFKEKVETRVKERAREQGAEAIKTASEKLEEELLRVIHGYGDRLKEFVEMAGDRLYRQIEEALEQVQADTTGDYDREELLSQVTLHLTQVRGTQAKLLNARSELEAWAVEQDFS